MFVRRREKATTDAEVIRGGWERWPYEVHRLRVVDTADRYDDLTGGQPCLGSIRIGGLTCGRLVLPSDGWAL